MIHSFRLRNQVGGSVSLQIQYQGDWCSVVTFHIGGKIIRSEGLPRGCGLILDGRGRIRHA